MTTKQAENVGFDLFMRHTDTDGKATVRSTRVWDKALFLAAREAEAQRENAKAKEKGKPALAAAQQITQEQYLKERK